MKRIYIIIFAAFFSFNSKAQEPNLEWVRQIGGTGTAISNSIKLDAIGNMFIMGYFTDTIDFDPGLGVQNLVSNGGFDVFILKLDPSANFLWIRQMGGILDDFSTAITLDANSNIYATGNFEGTVDFDPGPGVQTFVSGGSDDGFIQKFDSNGNLIWAKQIKCNDYLQSFSIAIDKNSNVYTRGSFRGKADFDPGVGTENLTSVGLLDAFLQKLDSNGNFLWAKQWGENTQDYGYSLSIDDTENVYTTGSLSGDLLIQKFDPAGSLLWERQINSNLGMGWQYSTIDASGNLLLTGWFQSTLIFDPTTGIQNIPSNGLHDIFVFKLDPNGNFLWTKSIGGSSFDEGYAITTNANNDVYLSGSFAGTVDFDPGPGTQNRTSAGTSDHYILKLDAAGDFQWVKQNGGLNTVSGNSIATNTNDAIYSTGDFALTVDFDPGPGTHNLTSTGFFRDIFIQN